MHNLISRNQLAEWIHIEEHLERANDELDLVNDYFDCLIECEEDQSTCKRVCRNLLVSGGWLPPFFCVKWWKVNLPMEKDKLKLIVRNLELLVDALKTEVYADVNAYKYNEPNMPFPADYDELYDDDDGYAD